MKTIPELKDFVFNIETNEPIEILIASNIQDYCENDDLDDDYDVIGNLIDEVHSDGYSFDDPDLIRSQCTYPITDLELKDFITKYKLK